MTGPEQHAATVRRLSGLIQRGLMRGAESKHYVALDELVALAREERERFHRHVETMIEPKLLERAEAAEEEITRLREGWDNWQRQALAAEVRIAELERERDEARGACEKAIRERRSLEIKEDDWHRSYEQARREADQLRAALEKIAEGDVPNLPFPNRLETHHRYEAFARAALAGVQAGCDHDFVFVNDGEYRCDKCGVGSRDGVQADNKDSA